MNTKTSLARIRSAPETDSAGLAGRVGTVMGWSMPEYSGVPTVGQVPDNFAYGVYIDELNDSYFLRPDLLEPVMLSPDGTFIPLPDEPDTSKTPWRDVSRVPAPPPMETPVTRLLARLESLLPRF